MSIRVVKLDPGPERATERDLRTARQRDRLLREELPRVREAAAAWRNGLGTLLVALIGFGLLKGRTDVTQLASAWAVGVGVTLLAALSVGAAGAVWLLRAAHGRPSMTAARDLMHPRVADHVEVGSSVKALRRGIGATLCCTLLLVAAVGMTWYGPEKSAPAVQVTIPGATVCGSVIRLAHSGPVLKTKAGEVSTDLSVALSLQAVNSCP